MLGVESDEGIRLVVYKTDKWGEIDAFCSFFFSSFSFMELKLLGLRPAFYLVLYSRTALS